MKEGDMIIASYVVNGMTEEDLHYVREHLISLSALYVNNDALLAKYNWKTEDMYSVETENDGTYSFMVLGVRKDVWEAFTQHHDMVEFSLLMAQENILSVVH